MTDTKDTFAKLVLDQINDTAFCPFASYDNDGDCIEFIAKQDPYYAERIDSVATVYYSEITEEIIGAQIKGVSKLIRDYPGFKVEIRDGQVELHLLLRAKIWKENLPNKNIIVRKYQKLIELAQANKAHVASSCLVGAR